MSAAAIKHIEHLVSVIGPRGSTTQQERQAHDYCQSTLEGLGYRVQRDTFLAPISAWQPYALALGTMLLAAVLFVVLGRGPNGQMGGLAAATLGLTTLISFVLQTQHQPNPLAWLVPIEGSQNVWVMAEPSGPARHSVVLSGHVDTHRRALAMRSPQLWQIFQALTMLTGVAMLGLTGLFIWGIFTPDPLPRTLGLYTSILLIIDLVFTLQPDFAPYVRGANDNASGAGAVLALAERLKHEPLEHTRVFLVNTGAEEVDSVGMAAWIERHARENEAAGAYYLILDNLAGNGAELNYVVEETILLPIRADPQLVDVAKAVASQSAPELEARPFRYRGLSSELSMARQRGQKALGLLNFDPRTRMPPNFHTDLDNLANIDAALLDRSERFVWALLRKIDAN